MSKRLTCLLFSLLLTGCALKQPSPASFLPLNDAIVGWTRIGETSIFKSDNLYDFIDGQADAFLAYNFFQVAVQRYQNLSGAPLGGETPPLQYPLVVDVWQVKSSEDAYGLFTSNRSGEPIQIGSGGDMAPGRWLSFWQGPYYIRLQANQSIPDTDLWAFAQSISSKLPPAGLPPEIIKRLPPDGLDQNSLLFFHQEISIQDELWLGGDNLLGLSLDTKGVLAKYNLQDNPVLVVLIQYPTQDQANAGLKALQSSSEYVNLAMARGTLLGAVFGEINPETGSQLLEQVLANP